ncbi:arylsulfatase [Opitutia bacterium ISCC 51]|nr:arylsulfatase [Opitutae bacterium ISCC 51]QXD27378.1 arylsulfatase [Opitutae bacterium ISCC 52]
MQTVKLFLILVVWCIANYANADDQRSNLLLIVADDMGFTDIGSFGGEIKTPHLDDLAASGIRLANFHAAPVCAPTRAMLMSGMDHHEAGLGSMHLMRVFDNGLAPNKEAIGYGTPEYAGYLSQRVAALPEILQDAGYHTYMTGKWDLGRALVQEHIPAGRGFEQSFAQLTGTALHLIPPDGGAHGGIARAEPFIYRENWDVVKELPKDYFSTKTFTDKIIEYIDGNKDSEQPFFAYLAFSAPHFPLQVPLDWRERYKNHYDEGYDFLRAQRIERAMKQGVLPDNVNMDRFDTGTDSWNSLLESEKLLLSRKMEIYAAMVENMDFHIGRVLDYLVTIGERENTFVLFMSDNGAAQTFPPPLARGYDQSLESLGQNNSFTVYGRGWASASMAPFRDVKNSLYEGGTRAAAIVNAFSLNDHGRVSQEYLTVQDVLPTLLDVAGVSHPGSKHRGKTVNPVRGKSFFPHLKNSNIDVRGDEAVGWELHSQRALVKGDWKIYYSGAETADWELYNLIKDPGEQEDLSNRYPDLKKDLIKQWFNYADEVGVAFE